MTPLRTLRRNVEGFTLVELLAVLAILSLLMGLAVLGYGKYRDFSNVSATVARISELQAALTKYEQRHGGYPFDTLTRYKVRSANELNEGSEALYVALHGADYPEGNDLPEAYLGNTDDDVTATVYHRHKGVSGLFEIQDAWLNPIAYFHPASYEKRATYRLADPADPSQPDVEVTAQLSKKTGIAANPDTYQLISAGPDHQFGTDDDVTNF